MRSLIWVDRGYTSVPGGHRVQLDQTAKALRAAGIEVEISDDPQHDLTGVDVVHSLGASATMLRRARMTRLPVVLSTVYSGKHYGLGHDGRLGRRARLNRNIRITASLWRRGSLTTAETLLAGLNETRTLFESADLLLPNSKGEALAISRELGVTTPMHVVPNGVDLATFSPPPTATAREGVLYVARIDPYKNQLALINALKGTGVPLTLVGAVHPHHEKYARDCRAVAKGVRFLPPMPQRELASLYRQAAVHAMPSWFETTGLSSLEAAACGAQVVTTNRGHAAEYFADMAFYCSPDDVSGIRSAVMRAIDTPAPPALRERIATNYTWTAAAAATAEAYRLVLER